jgi:predicted nuclease of restriction endonuclease-like (RecB) superfamily
LSGEFGNGFSRPNLFSMLRFAELWPDQTAVAALADRLSWSHFRELISIEQPLRREFYSEMCRREAWSVRTLRSRMQGMMYERTLVSHQPEAVIRQELDLLREENQMSPDMVFRDPYLLDFLGLADTYSEKDFESAILKELERFLLELGGDFTFIARQKRMPSQRQTIVRELCKQLGVTRQTDTLPPSRARRLAPRRRTKGHGALIVTSISARWINSAGFGLTTPNR